MKVRDSLYSIKCLCVDENDTEFSNETEFVFTVLI